MKVTRAVVFGLGMLGLLGFFALDGGDRASPQKQTALN